MIFCQLNTTDIWSNLLIVIMDCEGTGWTAGWAGVFNLGRMVTSPAEDAL